MVLALRHLILKNLSQYHLIFDFFKRLHREYLKVKRGYFLKMDRKFQKKFDISVPASSSVPDKHLFLYA